MTRLNTTRSKATALRATQEKLALTSKLKLCRKLHDTSRPHQTASCCPARPDVGYCFQSYFNGEPPETLKQTRRARAMKLSLCCLCVCLQLTLTLASKAKQPYLQNEAGPWTRDFAINFLLYSCTICAQKAITINTACKARRQRLTVDICLPNY